MTRDSDKSAGVLAWVSLPCGDHDEWGAVAFGRKEFLDFVKPLLKAVYDSASIDNLEDDREGAILWVHAPRYGPWKPGLDALGRTIQAFSLKRFGFIRYAPVRHGNRGFRISEFDRESSPERPRP